MFVSSATISPRPSASCLETKPPRSGPTLGCIRGFCGEDKPVCDWDAPLTAKNTLHVMPTNYDTVNKNQKNEVCRQFLLLFLFYAKFYLFVCLFIIYLVVYSFICLFVYLFIYLFIFVAVFFSYVKFFWCTYFAMSIYQKELS